MKKTLVVDDDELILQFLNDTFTEAGHQVAVARDGLAALEVLKTYTPDIITVDLVMPNIDGKQLCKIIREEERFKDTYIIILSATVAEEAINIVDVGANACIAKAPFEEMAKNLLETINEPDLATNRCLSGEVIGLDGIYPRRMTKELLSAKNHFELILSKMVEGIVEITPEGKIVYANPAFFSLVNRSEGKAFGSSFVDLFSKEDRKRVRGLIETGGGNSAAINEQAPVTLNGYQVTLKLLSTEDGGNAGRIVILNNVTEQKRAWEELQFRVELERLIANISTHFVAHNPAEIDEGIRDALKQIGEFTEVDCSFLLLFSDDRKEIVKTHLWHSGITGGQAEHANRYPVEKLPWAIEKLAQSGYISIPDVSEINLDGVFEKEILKSAKINCLITAPILYAGSLLGYLGFASVKKMEKRRSEIISLLKIVGEIFSNALAHKRNEREKLRLVTAVEQAGESIIITDPDGKIIYVNPAFERIAGYTRNEVNGKPFLMLMAPDNEALYRSIWETLNRGEVWKGKILSQKKTGVKIHTECTISPVRDQSGNIVNHVAVIRDVTKEVNMEMQVRQYQKMEAVGTFAGGMAHDFNNILGIIIGNTELAIDEVPRWNPVRNNLEEARKACLRAKYLVEQLRTFSQKTDPKKSAIRVTPIIEETFKFLRSSIPSTVEMRYDILSDSDTIIADPIQINQVLLSLCTNSVHAMGENGGTLEISLGSVTLDEETATRYNELSAGSYLRLTVSDTGLGIEPGVLNRIFDPYFTTKEPAEGKGMGLSVARGIIRNHNGTIKAYSEQGKGATFHVYLPLVEVEVSEETGKEEFLPTGDECILFVDDEQKLVNLGKQVLGRLGYSVITRTNSLEALELFRKNPGQFDLVISDLTMPVMTGDKLGKELIKLRPDISIILCSGSIEHTLKDKAKDLGVKAILMKPVEMKSLANTVRKVLDAELQDVHQ